MEIKQLQKEQYAWLKEVGWTTQTALEDCALICSEIGELVNECRGNKPTERFGVELADIVLRCVGVAGKQGIDLEAEILNKMILNKAKGTKGRLK